MKPKFSVVTGRSIQKRLYCTQHEVTCKYVVTARGMYQHPISGCAWLIYWTSVRKNVRLSDDNVAKYPGYSVPLRQVAYDFGSRQNTLLPPNQFVRVPIESSYSTYGEGGGHIGCVFFDEENWDIVMRYMREAI
jgi:hypothetical protein